MEFKLSLLEKRNIALGYGSSISSLNKAEKILNSLNILEEREDFFELLCMIALELEAMQDMQKNNSNLARSSLSEVIAAAIREKYGNLDELSPTQRCKAKIFIHQFLPEKEQ